MIETLLQASGSAPIAVKEPLGRISLHWSGLRFGTALPALALDLLVLRRVTRVHGLSHVVNLLPDGVQPQMQSNVKAIRQGAEKQWLGTDQRASRGKLRSGHRIPSSKSGGQPC